MGVGQVRGLISDLINARVKVYVNEGRQTWVVEGVLESFDGTFIRVKDEKGKQHLINISYIIHIEG